MRWATANKGAFLKKMPNMTQYERKGQQKYTQGRGQKNERVDPKVDSWCHALDAALLMPRAELQQQPACERLFASHPSRVITSKLRLQLAHERLKAVEAFGDILHRAAVRQTHVALSPEQ